MNRNSAISNSASLAPSSRSTFSSNLRSVIAAINSGHFGSVELEVAVVDDDADDDDDAAAAAAGAAVLTTVSVAGAAAAAAGAFSSVVVEVEVDDDDVSLFVATPRCSFCFSICFFNFDLYL